MRKYGSALRTEIVRIQKKDWEIIAELALLHGCNMAEATRKIITGWQKSAGTEPCNTATMPAETPAGYAPALIEIPGLRIEGNKIIGLGVTTASTMSIEPQNEPPLYNPMVHKAGDVVRVRRGDTMITMTVPEVDADGALIR